MSVKEIPALRIVICDCCRRECGPGGASRAEGGALHLKRDGLDFSGAPVGDASVRLDLCDSCLNEIGSAINETCERIRTKRVAEKEAKP